LPTKTKVTFDAATLADAVQKAARVAPTKGAAYDTAAGLCFDIDTIHSVAILKSTNLEVSYRQELSISDVKGENCTWRIPANMLAGLTANLPLGTGTVITFIDTGDSAIRIQSGTMTVKLNMITGDFPTIPPFDVDDLSDAYDFAQKVARVAWACEKDGSILSGVHVDGSHLVGCNRNVAAIIPCQVPLASPVTVPLFTLGTILRNATDVKVSAADKCLNIQLDAESQATSRLFEGAYPAVKGLVRKDYLMKVTFSRTAFVEAAKRLLVVAQNDRLPTIKFTFNVGLVRSLVLDLDVPQTGRIQDTIDITGDYTDPGEIWFIPSLIVPAIENVKDEIVTMEVGHEDPKQFAMKNIRISDSTGYEAIVMPRRPD
jgi:DNA polymerase III sliding clamp (beta) subunit (PCNA family)